MSPLTTVVADVSGKADGTTEVKALFGELLRRFDGLASDNYSRHYWRIHEIGNNVLVDGLTFFDFMGAYRRDREQS
jgi:hypothetical protein